MRFYKFNQLLTWALGLKKFKNKCIWISIAQIKSSSTCTCNLRDNLFDFRVGLWPFLVKLQKRQSFMFMHWLESQFCNCFCEMCFLSCYLADISFNRVVCWLIKVSLTVDILELDERFELVFLFRIKSGLNFGSN